MSLIILCTLVFFIMLLLPFVIARNSYETGKETRLLIRSDNGRDPRYFAKSFRQIFENAFASWEGTEVIHMHRDSKFFRAPFETETVDGIAYMENDYTDLTVRVFEEECYCAKDAHFPPGSHFRALAAGGTLTLGENSEVTRWVDSEKELYIKGGSHLGISASAGKKLAVGADCQFRRLYAPTIEIGEVASKVYPSEIISFLEGDRRAKATERELRERQQEAVRSGARSIEDIREEQHAARQKKRSDQVCRTDCIDEHERIFKHVIARKNLTIRSGSFIGGSVRARGHIHICAGAMITGNVIATGEIVVESGCTIAGNIFSQRSIYLDEGCVLGREGQIKSVIAEENILLCAGTEIHGYVSCERDGRIVNREEFIKEAEKHY